MQCSHSITSAILVTLLNNLAPSCAACFGAGSCCLVILGSSLDAPVKCIVVLVPLLHEEVTEEFVKIGVVRFVVKAKSTSVVQVGVVRFVVEAKSTSVVQVGVVRFVVEAKSMSVVQEYPKFM